MFKRIKLAAQTVFSSDRVNLLITLLYEVGRHILIERVFPTILEFATKTKQKASQKTVLCVMNIANDIYQSIEKEYEGASWNIKLLEAVARLRNQVQEKLEIGELQEDRDLLREELKSPTFWIETTQTVWRKNQ